MTTVVTRSTAHTLRTVLLLDFALASVEFGKARRRQSDKDTPAHRAAVEAAQDWIDAVLDMYLTARERRPEDR